MSTERIIRVADLTFIQSALRSVQNDIGTVSDQVEAVGGELAHTRSELSRLEHAFAEFVSADLKAKELADLSAFLWARVEAIRTIRSGQR